MPGLPIGRTFTVKAEGAGRQRPYVRTLALNGTRYYRLSLPHALIVKGGELVEQMSDIPVEGSPGGVPGGVQEPVFSISDVSVSKGKVLPDELFQVRFKLSNQGGPGTRIVVLKVNGNEYSHKNCLVWQGGAVMDSIGCRLYPYGKAILEIGGASVRKEVEVMGGEEGGRGLAGRSVVDGLVNLSVANKWVVGRNEEFPGERIFEGRVRDVRVYAAALGEGELLALLRN